VHDFIKSGSCTYKNPVTLFANFVQLLNKRDVYQAVAVVRIMSQLQQDVGPASQGSVLQTGVIEQPHRILNCGCPDVCKAFHGITPEEIFYP
jgi:hypothetical protein